MKVRDRATVFMETWLIWMKENQPELMLELHKTKKLHSTMGFKILAAMELEEQLEQNKDLDEFQIEEVILNFLAPAEGMDLDKENPITESQFNRIVEATMPKETKTRTTSCPGRGNRKQTSNLKNNKYEKSQNQKKKMSYFLRVYDNFHYMDDDDVDDIGSFNSEQEALKEAQRIVKNGVIRLWSTGTKIDEIVSSWLSFGTDPSIRCTDQNVIAPFFSAMKYAEAVVEELKASIQDDRENIQSVYQKTILFAAEKHAREMQYIPGTSITPYAVHLADVCMEIMLADQKTDGFNLKLAIQAALLHDTLEDTDTAEIELEEKFGIAILVCVKALTKNRELPEDKRMADSLNRIKKMPIEIWAVKLADRITNLQRPPDGWDNGRKMDYREEAKLILHELKDGNEFLARRLGMKIDEYQIYITD